MIEIVLLVLFFVGVDLLISWVFEKKISNSTSAQKSVQYRMIYRYVRIVIVIIYSCIIIYFLFFELEYIYFMLSNYLISSRLYAEICRLVIAFGFCLLPFYKFTLPISCLTISEIKSENFILLLRGFNNDDYTSYSYSKIYEFYQSISQFITNIKSDQKSKKSEEDLPISEYELYKAIKEKNLKFYSVGLPSELESPQGSTRIYLDNMRWKDDVITLIQKAQYVFVIVNDRESCLWEISQCEKIAQEKTIYLIENEEIIKSTQTNMKEMFHESLKLYLQQFSNSYMRPHRRVYIKNGKVEIDHLANNRYGFKMALDDILINKES